MKKSELWVKLACAAMSGLAVRTDRESDPNDIAVDCGNICDYIDSMCDYFEEIFFDFEDEDGTVNVED